MTRDHVIEKMEKEHKSNIKVSIEDVVPFPVE